MHQNLDSPQNPKSGSIFDFSGSSTSRSAVITEAISSSVENYRQVDDHMNAKLFVLIRASEL